MTPPQTPHDRWDQTHSAMGERSNYKAVWDRQAGEYEIAALAVAGHTDEAALDATAEVFASMLEAAVGLHPTDLILEIGCGIGRLGRVFSARCLHWFGTDISGRMIKHAARRLQDRPNVTLIELSTVGLPEFPDDSLDVVYCTVVFMHLYEWDRYRYVEEAYRVLRPGGRCYFDNVPLDTAHGWQVFQEGARYPLERRPAHLSMCSTREELSTYLSKAGFGAVRVLDQPNGRIAAVGIKPDPFAAAPGSR